MPLLNNDDPWERNRRLLIGAIVVIVLVIFFVGLFSGKKKPASTDAGSTVDSASGQTVSNPPGKTPETYGTDPNTPLYLGFDALVINGLTANELDSTKTALLTYAVAQKPHNTQFSIYQDSIATDPVDPNSTTDRQTMHFTMQVDKKTDVKVRLDYFDFNNVELYLYKGDPSTTPPYYDSGVIDPSAGD